MLDMIRNVQRHDAGAISKLRPARRMPDGRVRVDAYITRVGVFRYTSADGSVRRELRHRDDVMSRASLDSFAQVPVTNDHPESGLITSRNAKKYAVGATDGSVRPEGDHVATELVVYDQAAIDDMDAGKTQLSGGYTCDLEMQGGVDPEFGAYDARQRNIRGNHVAIVNDGRAGPTVRARMDSAGVDGVMVAEDAAAALASMRSLIAGQEQISGGERSIGLRVGGVVSVSPSMDPEKLAETLRAVTAQLKDAETKLDKAEGDAKSEKTRADVADGELKIAKTKIAELHGQVASQASAVETEALKKEKERSDGLAAKVARFDETFKTAVRARARLEREASIVMGQSFRMDDLDERQIQSEVVKKLDSNADVSMSVADGVIVGMFNALVAGYMRQARQIADVGSTIAAHADDHRATADASREDEGDKKRQAFRDQWKKPLPSDARSKQA